jgi:hypothetical protein
MATESGEAPAGKAWDKPRITQVVVITVLLAFAVITCTVLQAQVQGNVRQEALADFNKQFSVCVRQFEAAGRFCRARPPPPPPPPRPPPRPPLSLHPLPRHAHVNACATHPCLLPRAPWTCSKNSSRPGFGRCGRWQML